MSIAYICCHGYEMVWETLHVLFPSFFRIGISDSSVFTQVKYLSITKQREGKRRVLSILRTVPQLTLDCNTKNTNMFLILKHQIGLTTWWQTVRKK